MKLQGWFSARACRAAMAGMLALLAAGCSDTDDGGPDAGSTAAISGTAAVGAPIIGGTITARCGGGQTFSATSDGAGNYRIELPGSALPCALQITGGQVNGAPNPLSYHSFASAAGTTNLTPITDLAVAIASGMTPSAWFAAISASAPPQLRNLANAAARLLERLEDAGYTVPGNLNPFTTPFTATLANAYDQLLESLGAALRAAAMSHDQLLVQVVEDGAEFDLPEPEEEEPGPGPGGNTAPATINSGLVGSFTYVYHQTAAGAPFADQADVPVVIGANNTLQIDGKTLSNPFKRNGNEAEIIWADSAKKLEYALSHNDTGTFNEINVGDSSRANAQGIPFFLGQIREKAPVNNVPPLLKAIGGTYMATVFDRDGSFQNTNAVNSSVAVVIDAGTGVIDIDGSKFRIDPASSSFFFENRVNTTEPSYQVLDKHSDQSNLTFDIFLLNGQVSGFRLRRSVTVNGVATTSRLIMEIRPLPEALITFFNDFVARTPVTVTEVLDDVASDEYDKCERTTIKASIQGTAPNQKLVYEIHDASLPDGQGLRFRQTAEISSTKYEEHNGNRRLTVLGTVFVLRGGEGNYVDLETRRGSTLIDRSTNDPAQVNPVCSPP